MALTATSCAVAELRGGRTVLTTLRSQVPLRLRETCDGLTVVASAFGPLGGDRTALDVTLGPGARLTVGSAAEDQVYSTEPSGRVVAPVTVPVGVGRATGGPPVVAHPPMKASRATLSKRSLPSRREK